MRWLGMAAGAAFAFIVALFFARQKGKDDAEAKLAKKDRLDKIAEAGKRGDLDALDEQWRER